MCTTCPAPALRKNQWLSVASGHSSACHPRRNYLGMSGHFGYLSGSILNCYECRLDMPKLSTRFVRRLKVAIPVLVLPYCLIVVFMDLGVAYIIPVHLVVAPMYAVISLFQEKPPLTDRSRVGFSDHIVQYYFGGVLSAIFLSYPLMYQDKVVFGNTWYTLAFCCGMLIALIAIIDMLVQIFRQRKWRKSQSQ